MNTIAEMTRRLEKLSKRGFEGIERKNLKRGLREAKRREKKLMRLEKRPKKRVSTKLYPTKAQVKRVGTKRRTRLSFGKQQLGFTRKQ